MSGRQYRPSLIGVMGYLLDPGLCTGCGQTLRPLQHFCSVCRATLECINHACILCGLENHSNDATCPACLYDPPRWQRLIAPLIYRGFSRDLLIQLKFNASLHLANSLVTRLIEHFRQGAAVPQVLIPVPLHQKRLIERGYNQAFEIANIISRQLNIPIDTLALQRIRDTESQRGLSAAQREKNIVKAFKVVSELKYAHVAVIDDIITTGSTANEVTKTL
ncbi:MAG: ComF family protein, partial [Gammaproteobacteria bacterium]